ncbi:glyoxalase [Amycolatopsis magusensis]|uniref:glyoxalase n=1 Tax=Amycolatopsis magusensis TaxID=882444 RepID=UPI003C2B0F00
MTAIEFITLDVADTEAANRFYTNAFGADLRIRVRPAQPATTGFRGYTLSLIVSQPANVDLLVAAALDGGATSLKPAAKSLWGYGGSVRAPDGAIWTIATSSKKDTEPASRKVDDLVLSLGVDDVVASKRFYAEQGLAVGKSFARMYVEFESGEGSVKLALNRRRALAKNAGVDPGGTGSHRLTIGGGAFTDPDGFAWEPATSAAKQ